ncbi:MAG: hypothetical protein HY287_13880 [Planctomycetes bacterium]|nr:hypothetical protein [Planctomycetota bacterium]MBI3835411.1 hypothetical protein [Planctomycetota bacterium]
MLRRETLRAFVVRLVIVYGILIAPWPGLKPGYAKFFRGSANALIGVVGLKEYVSLDTPPEEHADWDIQMSMRNPVTNNRWHGEYSSRAFGYLPTAAMLTLVLAIPGRRRNRLRALIASLVLIQFFVIVRIAVAIGYGMYAGGVIHLGERMAKFAEILLLATCDSPALTYIIAILVWLLVSFSKQDWEAAIAARSESKSQAGS